ncbi:hypothetical protein [Paenibacillus sp. sgz5001063]|uniref:hypothetical protein n=1 Tax=Paenibacillus sp. sgz5001063 TaxID=3242474 RepID=UPI0036D2F594
MSMAVHNLMAYNPHYFRPQPVADPKPQRSDDHTLSFKEILSEKLKAQNGMKK